MGRLLVLVVAAQGIGGGPGGVLDGPARTSREIMHFMQRNPAESALYGGLILLFVWAVWRFGKS